MKDMRVNALALLALKAAPNVFDISSGQYNVSIRDQIVRGQLLVRDLCSLDDEFKNLLVVGAGVGGAAVAMAAAASGKNVRIVDSREEPFNLQRDKPGRFVGPFMYEWPDPIHGAQSYPPKVGMPWGEAMPSTPAWSAADPISAKQLAEDLSRWLGTGLRQYVRRLECWCEVDTESVVRYVTKFVDEVTVGEASTPMSLHGRRWTSASARASSTRADPGQSSKKSRCGKVEFLPDYIILAAGMGIEKVTLEGGQAGVPFWGDDDLLEAGTSDLKVGVFGGGDGAMQDVLRALTGFDHPLAMIDKLRKNANVANLLDVSSADLLAIEAQGRLYGSWTLGDDAFRVLDASCRKIAAELASDKEVRAAVRGCLRKGKGRVVHVVREPHFTKAYLLNRFLVHLIERVQARGRVPKTRMSYSLRLKHVAVDSRVGPDGVTSLVRVCPIREQTTEEGVHAARSVKAEPVEEWLEFDRIAVRFGMIERSKASSEADPNAAVGESTDTGENLRGMQMIQLKPGRAKTRAYLSHIPLPFVVTR